MYMIVHTFLYIYKYIYIFTRRYYISGSSIAHYNSSISVWSDLCPCGRGNQVGEEQLAHLPGLKVGPGKKI